MAEHSFHPHPVVGFVKALFVAIFLTMLIVYTSMLIGEWFLYLLVIIWGGALIQMGLIYVISKHHTITLEGNNVLYVSGLLSQQRVVLPYPRITEASYRQGVVQRLLGVGTLKLDTAGGSTMAIYIADIRYTDLQKILAEIKEKGHGDENT